jgi:dephospho-CoA kinase
MMIVGLTGGIGSGKSEAARLFANLGVPVADTDAIAHALTATGQPALREISKAFGDEVLQTDGSLNRACLRQRIFSDPAARQVLESILHPKIRDEVASFLDRNASAPYQIVMVPLLFETGAYANLIDCSLLIDCDESLQIMRAMARSNLSEAEVRAIMAAQCSREQRLALTSDVILNNGTLADLKNQVREKHEKYIRLA